MLSHAARSAVEQSVVDPNFKNVSLLLHGDGTNGKQNGTFLTGNPNLDPSSSPFPVYYYATFNGTNQYLSQNSGAIGNFGTGDFTVEAWVYASALVADRGSIVSGLGATNGDWMFAINNNIIMG